MSERSTSELRPAPLLMNETPAQKLYQLLGVRQWYVSDKG